MEEGLTPQDLDGAFRYFPKSNWMGQNKVEQFDEKNCQIEWVKTNLNNLTKKLLNWIGQNNVEQFDEKNSSNWMGQNNL